MSAHREEPVLAQSFCKKTETERTQNAVEALRMTGRPLEANRSTRRALVAVLSLIALLVLPQLAETSRCLSERAAHRPRRFLSYNGTTMNLTLQVSSRVPHQLTTAALEIFLSDVLGYEDVVTVPEPSPNLQDIIQHLSAMRPNGSRTLPPAMMNLEVVVAPDEDYVYYLAETSGGTVVSYGDLAAPAHRGWFVPQHLHRDNNSDWTLFTRPDRAAIYSLHNHLDYLMENARYRSKDSDIPRYVCEKLDCTNGTFTPRQCESEPCAVLLTTYPEETSFVISHIQKLNLYVKVIWLGPNLPQVVRSLVDKMKTSDKESLVFLDWTPTHTELVGERYVSLTMPRCDGLASTLLDGCHYEMSRIMKLGWSQLPRQASRAWKTFHLANFTLPEYGDLIKHYLRDPKRDIRGAACSWMKENEDVWKSWIFNRKEEISIGGIFPFTGSSHNAFGIAVAASMATDAVNRDPTVLADFDLRVLLENGNCQADMVMRRFIDYILGAKDYDRLLGVLGPACSETLEPLAGVSKHYKTAVISYSAEGMSFADREKYPYFFRTIGENRQFKHVYFMLLQELGWRRVAAITEDGQKHTEYISYMENFLVNQGMEFVVNAKFPKDDMKSSIVLYLEELSSKRARVIIADVDEAAARALMCAAYELHMTAREGYVWFLPPWLPPHWYDAPMHNKRFNENVPCSLKEMLEAIDGHFSIAHAPYAPEGDLMQENKTVGQWKAEYAQKCNGYAGVTYRGHAANRYLPDDHDIRSKYAGYAYDAVWTYALAFDKLLKEHPAAISDLHHDKYTNLFVKIIGDIDFNGVSGNIRFRGGSSRFSTIIIMQWVNNSSNIVGSFYPNISKTRPEIIGGRLDLDTSQIVWLTPDGTIPDDGTEICTFQGLADILNVDCHKAFVIFNILLFLGLATILLAAFFYFKNRFEKNYRKQMISMGLNILDPSKIATLDTWEIPRERIVINRKLGMGAFGTVYGGHALFSEEKGWTAVAVKTLKGGSTTESKLDFLSEAEAMKRFEHKNIVKLLAVTTKTEPVCTIMEFMLYGDLKNYLLARRHLVHERDSEESDEVSSKKLTSMALDVARALSYLAELKYVHRDVACRNCLVNSHRVVKLGDFGMTRLIFENDYYRFSRKGMLPVRWMAPESLGLGIFSQASDVWSFGVLLYEIITFGSLPFQGLSNSEVLTHVKNGGTITLPPGIKPQLEGLIKSCWKTDYKNRPHASEIAEFLATNTRLLAPCLDVPLDSMSLDDSAQWRLLPEPGKVSVGVSYGRPHLLPSEHSSAALSTAAQFANSTSTNLTYVSTDLSLNGPTRDYHADIFDDEKTSFLA